MSSGPGPPRPPPLENHFFGLLRGGGGLKNVEKMTRPFLGLKIMNLLVFFSILSQKVFPGHDSMGFVWGGVGRALMRYMHFS